MISDANCPPNAFNMWQTKLIFQQIFKKDSGNNLICKESALSLQKMITHFFEKWENLSKSALKKYVLGNKFEESLNKFDLQMLSTYSILYDLPYNINVNSEFSYLELLIYLQNSGLCTSAISKIAKMCDIEF